jgi:segregation and condensation protein A
MSEEILHPDDKIPSEAPESTPRDEAALSAEEVAPLVEVEEPVASSTEEQTPVVDPVSAEATETVQPTEAPFALEPKPVPPPAPEPKRAAANKDKEEASQSPFSVTVGQVYDGPFDLLLDLIRKQNIDIYDIPIARITSQFLDYTHHLKQVDVDAAGEFIYMASLLIHIKSKTLLPRDPTDVLGGEAEDPRRELVERLLEHERFKAAAQMLMQKQQIEEATWSASGMKNFRRDAQEAGGEELNLEREIAADTVDLVRVFQDILSRLRARPILNVDEESVTVAQMIDYVKRRLLMEDKPVSLRRLLHNTHTERALICMFLAMLELVRLQAVLLHQPILLGDILIKKTEAFDQVFADQAQARDDWR